MPCSTIMKGITVMSKSSKGETVYLSEIEAVALTVSVATVVATEAKARKGCEDVCKVAIPKLHSAGIVIGRRNKANPEKSCRYAMAFCDALLAEGLAAKTVNNYLTTFKHAVATGIVPKDWHKQRKGKAKRTEKEFSAMLASVAMFDDGVPFAELLTWMELAYEDAQYDSLLLAFDDYLAMHGEKK